MFKFDEKALKEIKAKRVRQEREERKQLVRFFGKSSDKHTYGKIKQ